MKLKNMRIVSYGEGYGMYFPKALFDTGLLLKDQEYDVDLEPSKDTPKQENATE